MRQLLGIWGLVLFLLAGVNFVTFVVVALCIGGDAASGKVEGGRYYVANHGQYTEVSRSVWQYSKIHAESVSVTQPVGLFVGGGMIASAMLLSYRERKPHTARQLQTLQLKGSDRARAMAYGLFASVVGLCFTGGCVMLFAMVYAMATNQMQWQVDGIQRSMSIALTFLFAIIFTIVTGVTFVAAFNHIRASIRGEIEREVARPNEADVSR